MQNPATTPPAPPTPPAQGVAVPGASGGAAAQVLTPFTANDVASLRHRRSELSSQLNSATGRRDDLAKELWTASGAAREGITARIVQLDQRILQIEADIAANGRLLAAVPASGVGSLAEAGGIPLPGKGELAIIGSTLVLFPLALAFARLIWRRTTRLSSAPPDTDVGSRLGRIEQAVDAIAIEVERVSESQRYLTRTMAGAAASSAPAALGAGAAPMQPISVGDEARVPVPAARR